MGHISTNYTKPYCDYCIKVNEWFKDDLSSNNAICEKFCSCGGFDRLKPKISTVVMPMQNARYEHIKKLIVKNKDTETEYSFLKIVFAVAVIGVLVLAAMVKYSYNSSNANLRLT